MCPNTPFLAVFQPAQADCLYKNSVDSSIFVSIAKGHTSQLLPWFGVLSKAYVNTSNISVGSQGPTFQFLVLLLNLPLVGTVIQDQASPIGVCSELREVAGGTVNSYKGCPLPGKPPGT